jgi:hypothetical protein
MSELRGRKLPLVISMFGVSVFAAGSATAKRPANPHAMRFFMGVFGSCPVAVVAAVYAVTYGPEARGLALTVFASSVFMGLIVAPFISGFTGKNFSAIHTSAYTVRSDKLLRLAMGRILVDDNGLRHIDFYGLGHARDLPTNNSSIQGRLSPTSHQELGHPCQTRRSRSRVCLVCKLSDKRRPVCHCGEHHRPVDLRSCLPALCPPNVR